MTRIEITEKHSSNNNCNSASDGKKIGESVASLETELEDLDDCMDRSTVVGLINEIVPMLINEKGKSSSDSSEESEESDSVET
ncbi:380_t:CDS:2, partial [Gigaspora margarita]